MTKGIILAGGKGTRLYPITLGVSKQLLPVYDKPLIHYAIGILMMSGVKDILVITSPEHLRPMEMALGDGDNWGIKLQYKVQEAPNGIAEAFLIGADFIGDDDVALVLGDNIFYGQGLGQSLVRLTKPDGANILAASVRDPERYGIVEISHEGKPISIQEKPHTPRSNLAIPGLYFFNNSVVEVAGRIKPSARGELEITSVIDWYLSKNLLNVSVLPRGTFWMDAGTVESLNSASTFMRILEERQQLKVSCLEEIAWRQGWIDSQKLIELAEKYLGNEYGSYLLSFIE